MSRTFGTGPEDFKQAEWLAFVLDGEWRYDHTADRWHHWNGVRWEPDQTRQIELVCAEKAAAALPSADTDELRKSLMKLFTLPALRRALEALATFPGYGTNGEDWDTDEYLLGCDNGIVDLRTNSLVEADATMLVTKTTGATFTPVTDPKQFTKRAPRFMKALMEWTSGDEDLAYFLLFWFGASMFGFSPEQRFLLMTGIGRNGKGALKHSILAAAGEYAEELDANLYMRSKFGAARSNEARADLMKLKGLRIAFFSEPQGGQFNEELLKAHTGGDRITARALYSNNVQSWDPTHSISFLTNDLPAVDDVGPSMGERVMVADFRESFEGSRQDRKLYDRLTGEKDGILAILVWAASIWYARWSGDGGLILPERVIEQSKAFMERNDPLSQWLDERAERGSGQRAPSQVAYESYLNWHRVTMQPGEGMSPVKFALMLQKKGFTKERTRTGAVWTGFSLLGAMALAEKGVDEDEEP